jgi:hypothetical protein
MRKFIANLLIVLMWLPAVAQQGSQSRSESRPEADTAPTQSRLPVRKVVLYKNGVGYFEHSGRVRGNQDVTVDFTTAQLNDVLQSLTVLDLGKGHINGVSYNSTAPLDQRLRALRLPLSEKPSQAEFLDAIRGARVEIRSGAAVAAGRLLSVEEHERKQKDETVTSVTYISLMTDAGEIKNFELSPATSVRILDRDLQDDAARFLKLLSTARQQESRRMTISAAGSGERELFVSYVSEVPVWKSTYRIVLPDGQTKKPILQGWAVVDNTVGEDWENVQLSLVAGAPQSFVQQISQPYYTRRPVVALPASMMLQPQTYEATLDNYQNGNGTLGALSAPAAPPAAGAVSLARPASMAYEQMGLASKSARVVNGAAQSVEVTDGAVGGVGRGVGGGIGGGNYNNWLVESAAHGQELGDLFEYKLTQPITIRKNQSALVPILQHEIEAEQVSIWSEGTGRALRGLWLTNSSGLTLDAGSFNVLEGGSFAGEGLLDPVKPGERRLVSYAVDLGLHVEAKRRSDRQRVSSLRLARGVLTQVVEMREKRTYVIRNEDTQPRTVVIEHPVRPGWKLAEVKAVSASDDAPAALKPAETSASFYRFKVTVDPKKTFELPVTEYEPVARNYMLSNLQTHDIDLLVQQRDINPELEQVLRRVVAQKGEIAELESQIKDQQEQVGAINDDQQRVRENLKALKGSAEERQLVQRYTAELNEQEDKVQSLRKSISALQQRRGDAQRSFDRMLQELTFEAAM